MYAALTEARIILFLTSAEWNSYSLYMFCVCVSHVNHYATPVQVRVQVRIWRYSVKSRNAIKMVKSAPETLKHIGDALLGILQTRMSTKGFVLHLHDLLIIIYYCVRSSDACAQHVNTWFMWQHNQRIPLLYRSKVELSP